MKVILVHGINTAEGMANVGRLKTYIEQTGVECVLFEYGYLGAWLARFRNPELARRLAHLVTPGDAVIGHSNGCAIIWLAYNRFKARFGHISLINPALDCDREFPGAVPRVYHNAGDDVVWWSKILLWHPWGEMGNTGACAPGFINHDCAATLGMPKVWGHSDIFSGKKISKWGRYIAERIQNN